MQLRTLSASLGKNQKTVQTAILRDIERTCRGRANNEMLIKLSRMHTGATIEHANVLLDRVGKMAACLPGSAAGLFLRSAADAWATPSRFGAHLPCAFGGVEAGASMRHFVTCPTVRAAVQDCCSPLACEYIGSIEAFLAIQQPTPDIQVLGMLHLVLHNVLMAVLKRGHSPEGARALIKSAVVGLATRGKPFPAVARRPLKANPHAIRGVVQPPILVT